MASNLPVRLALVLGVNVVAFGAFFAATKFGIADQSSLAQSVLVRLQGDPDGLQIRVDDLAGQLLAVGAAAIGIAFALAVIWLIMLEASPPVGDASARAKRQPWAGLLVATVLAASGAGWALLINAPIAELLASGVGVTGIAFAVVLAVIGYWVGTGLGAPRSCKVAVPGFGG
jgi:hypothetical protein